MHSASSLRSDGRVRDHVLDLEVLQPGDIVLSTTSEKISRSIRFFTNSPYSHAMLYVGNSLIHADGDGVFSLNPQRRIVASDEIAVFRLRGGLDAGQQATVINHVRSEVGSLYSVPHAIVVGLMKFCGRDRSGKQFCSRLVAQSYRLAGQRLVRNADYCSPGALARSPLLERIENALRPITCLDAQIAATPDQLLEHQRQTFQWLRWVREIARSRKKKITNITSALDFIEAHPDIDVEAAGQLKLSGYLDHYRADESINTHRYSAQDFMQKYGPSREVLEKELSLIQGLAERVATSRQDAANRPVTKTFNLLRDLHQNRAQQLVVRLDVILHVAAANGHPDLAYVALNVKAQLKLLTMNR
ncbi:hypothetical protein E5C33_11465 [Stenotrophomonas maltophilia]|uniref:YiiX/YebB-like N1pC/P60 family cysteine hydrolase n=1 Tax=Stenotrophomonas maltophilia TaxID=40324 RepID=UPI0010760049|nr:YiiX/YebB-like N1pC/P60 family cysteine hydrolase [Stenotrophomonas maltophilia]TFZ45083.1 hypothetical protein E5C33_11465 [Stenotrophomonas maltophilia]